MSELSNRALEIAISQIGKEENPRGSNWGKAGDPVPEYLASVGITIPASWCMAFMYWIVEQAVKALVPQSKAVWIPDLQSYNPLVHTGSVLTQWKQIRFRYRLQEDEPPLPGDIFIMDLGHGLGHTGIIESIDADGTLHTIEGNTNADGSRNGYAVERKVRHNKAPIIGYLRF